MRTTELYALVHGQTCQGNFECHWCGASCNSFLKSDEIVVPFLKVPRYCLRPSSPFICIGCWLYRKRQITIPFLSGGFKDRQSAENYSWWIDKQEAIAITPNCYQDLYSKLLNPPRCFSLSIITSEMTHNRLQYTITNDIQTELIAEERLGFTIDQVPFYYTIYELEQALQKPEEINGKEPGVQAIVSLLGSHKLTGAKYELIGTGKGRGRPKEDEAKSHERSLKRIAVKSGK